MAAEERKILVAAFGAAKGLRGEIALRSYMADPETVAEIGPLSTTDGRSFRILSLRMSGNTLVARVAGIGDRTQAEAVAGTELFADRSALPAELEEDEFYHEDLVGLRAMAVDGEPLGTVSAVHNFGAGDILELRLVSGKSAMIPFSKAAVPSVDIAASRIVVDPGVAGLVDNPDDTAEREDGRP